MSDPRRTVAVRVVDDLDDDGGAGAVEVRAFDGVVWGYGFGCPGCGAPSFLALATENPEPRWTGTAGDVRDPATVSLVPSILHATERGGCGWHGFLTHGVFTSL